MDPIAVLEEHDHLKWDLRVAALRVVIGDHKRQQEALNG